MTSVTVQDNYANPSEPTEAMTFSAYGNTAFVVQYWNGNGQGKGGDKVISVLLDLSIKDLGRRVRTDGRTGKVISDVPNTSDL